jgi:hypothetical protein
VCVSSYITFKLGILDVRHWWQLGLILSDNENKLSVNIDDKMKNINLKKSSVKISTELENLPHQQSMIEESEKYSG